MHMIGKPVICSTRGMCFHVEYMECGRDKVGAKFGKNQLFQLFQKVSQKNAFWKTAVV